LEKVSRGNRLLLLSVGAVLVVRKMESFGSSPFLPPPALMIWRRENERETYKKKRRLFVLRQEGGGRALEAGKRFSFPYLRGRVSPLLERMRHSSGKRQKKEQ
jgi:hypothetical protein